MAVTPAQRDRLTDVRNRARDLRDRRNRARDFHKQAREAAAAYSGDDLQRSDEFASLTRAVGDLEQINQSLELVESEEKWVLGQMAGVDGGVIARDSFLHDPGVLEELRQLASSSAPIGNLNLGQAVSREDWMAKYTGRFAGMDYRTETFAADPSLPESAPSRLGVYQGVVPQLRRRLTLLDLLTTSTMDGNSFVFTAESGNLDTAAETQELTIKPHGDLVVTDVTVYARTIAHYVKMARQQLADVPQLGTTVTTRLVYGVNRRLETQILSGDGVGEHLLGILNTSGIGAPASGAGDTNNADLVGNAVSTVETSNAVPTAIVMNPIDIMRALKLKATGSGERLDSQGAFGAIPDSMWGLNLVSSTGITQGTALVADFNQLGVLYVREGVNTRVSDADSDDFINNRITALAEGRFAWATFQPTAAAKVTLSFPA